MGSFLCLPPRPHHLRGDAFYGASYAFYGAFFCVSLILHMTQAKSLIQVKEVLHRHLRNPMICL
jgi:hypothetical protein